MMSYRVQKVWRAHDAVCVVAMMDRGHRCGYVGVPEGHPLYGHSATEPIKALNGRTMLASFDVHGCLYFAEGGDDYPINLIYGPKLWWLGYDCMHYGDCADPEWAEVETVRLFDDGTIKSLYYCINECESLARQIKVAVAGEVAE